MQTNCQKKVDRWVFPPTGATLAPEESIQDLKLELLTVSRMYRNTPAMAIDQWVVFGMSKQKFIDSVFNRMYNQYSYGVDMLLDKILGELK